MGEMKEGFMIFLEDCFKNDFFETISWGNFRRFQLVLSHNNNWINLFFIVIKNESASDILINSFKILIYPRGTYFFINRKSYRRSDNL